MELLRIKPAANAPKAASKPIAVATKQLSTSITKEATTTAPGALSLSSNQSNAGAAVRLKAIAPTTNIKEIQNYISKSNPIAENYQAGIEEITTIKENKSWSKLITNAGTEINLYENHPAHSLLSQCTLALTTVGANTAELGALGVPMIVIVPTQHLHVMQAWDGILGLIGRLPSYLENL